MEGEIWTLKQKVRKLEKEFTGLRARLEAGLAACDSAGSTWDPESDESVEDTERRVTCHIRRALTGEKGGA